VGQGPKERQQIFSDLKKMYRRRREIVHRTYDPEKYVSGQFVRSEELDAPKKLERTTWTEDALPIAVERQGPEVRVGGSFPWK
jgi:hypothetical protein